MGEALSAAQSSAREAVLARIRTARAVEPTRVEVRRDYHRAGRPYDYDLVDRFTERIRDYRATVRHCDPASVEGTVAAVLADRGRERIAVPTGFPVEWAPPTAVADDPPMAVAELDALDGTLTMCALAIAETGTIVLDAGPGQGRRALTLVPDYHLVVVRADQIVANVPDAVAALDPANPLTWISGPSATSDIELNRVEGVHGPRTLDVIVVRSSLDSPTELTEGSA